MSHQRVTEGSIVLPTGPTTYRLRRSPRAKRLLLKVDSRRGVEVVVPRWASYRDATKFIHAHQDWLITILQKLQAVTIPPTRQLATGEQLPYLGAMVRLQVEYKTTKTRPTVKLIDQKIIASLSLGYSVSRALTRWYREAARVFFTEECAILAPQLNVSFNGITIGGQKTRWGSCSPRGRLAFNWRLLLGPRAVARYVAAHEVAHLRHRNHSSHFWNTVAQLDPDYREHKTWLRKNGPTLNL